VWVHLTMLSMGSLVVVDEKGPFLLHRAKRRPYRQNPYFGQYLSDILSSRFEISCVKPGDPKFIDQVSSQRLKCS